MSTIVCATRGGASSLAVQQQAIERAREGDHRLIFLYVVDTTTFEGLDDSLVPAVSSELGWIGATLLNIAKNRAEAHDVEAETQIRHGVLRGEIEALLTEESADLLLLGTPRGTTRTVFGDDAIERFADSVSEATGVEVKLVRAEEVTDIW
ncbi:MAG: universal stress protein [Candidatus Promineifilaceae bacterium]|nr:universal stress protein [Candidatus Promineifilaceae bacterium]